MCPPPRPRPRPRAPNASPLPGPLPPRPPGPAGGLPGGTEGGGTAATGCPVLDLRKRALWAGRCSTVALRTRKPLQLQHQNQHWLRSTKAPVCQGHEACGVTGCVSTPSHCVDTLILARCLPGDEGPGSMGAHRGDGCRGRATVFHPWGCRLGCLQASGELRSCRRGRLARCVRSHIGNVSVSHRSSPGPPGRSALPRGRTPLPTPPVRGWGPCARPWAGTQPPRR